VSDACVRLALTVTGACDACGAAQTTGQRKPNAVALRALAACATSRCVERWALGAGAAEARRGLDASSCEASVEGDAASDRVSCYVSPSFGPCVLSPPPLRRFFLSASTSFSFGSASCTGSSAHHLLLWPVACGLSPVACRLWPVACRLSPVACRLSPVACRLWRVVLSACGVLLSADCAAQIQERLP
jgi:hypothetical protein